MACEEVKAAGIRATGRAARRIYSLPAAAAVRIMSVAELLLPFCEAASLSAHKQPSDAVCARFVVSLACADQRAVLGALCGADKAEAVDWGGVARYLPLCNYGSEDWARLLGLLDFENEVASPAEMADLLSNTRAGVRVSLQGRRLDPLGSMRLCFAKAGHAPTWDVLCKALLACNLCDAEVARVLGQLVEPQVFLCFLC